MVPSEDTYEDVLVELIVDDHRVLALEAFQSQVGALSAADRCCSLAEEEPPIRTGDPFRQDSVPAHREDQARAAGA